jgi:hypothetical protein
MRAYFRVQASGQPDISMRFSDPELTLALLFGGIESARVSSLWHGRNSSVESHPASFAKADFPLFSYLFEKRPLQVTDSKANRVHEPFRPRPSFYSHSRSHI